MSDARWEHLKDLLHQAMQLAPEEQQAFIETACPADANLRAELQALLAANDRMRPGFLESLPSERNHDADMISPIESLSAGYLFAQHFRLEKKLGEGGMGQVWLAEQLSPVQRRVALKLIRAGMYDESIALRFQAERQSLAMMDHPAIAKVFEAGATPQGQPYFVMEYVPGLPITEYCDQHKLKIRDRLELFIQACDGVQHAHQKAFIHRDLKPANILVVEVDGKPQPRIIDFGLVKGAAPKAADEINFSRWGQFLGTPGYMSPEQADHGAGDVDTRTDVYSLGAILYVLLTGRLPFETGRQPPPPLDELLRRLREDDPSTPSGKVEGERETVTAVADARSTGSAQLVRALRGDLDWIAMKALEKDRARRYGTPSELSADLRRYLDHEPIMARPTSAGYRLKKYVRRRRVSVSVIAGLFLLLTGFAVLQTLELRRTTAERDRADRITDFMTGMFKVSDPSESRGSSVTAREILDKAANSMSKSLAGDPEVRAQMLQVMADTYLNLGLFERAHDLAQQSLDARVKLLGPQNPKTLASMSQVAWTLTRQRRDADAEKLYRQALEAERRVLGPGSPLILETMDHFSVTLQHEGRYDEGEKLERDTVESATRSLGVESPLTLQALNHLGGALFYQGRYAEAEKVYRELLDVDRRVLGSDHPETLKSLGNLAMVILQQDRPAEAEPLDREALAIQQRVLGPDHENTATAMQNLANLLIVDNRLAEGEKLTREALQIRLRTVGPEHGDTLNSEFNLGEVLYKEGRLDEAEKLQRQTWTTRARLLGPKNPLTLVAESNLAQTLIGQGRYPEAEAIARAAHTTALGNLGPRHPDTLETLKQLGKALAHMNRYPEANKLFLDALKEQTGSAAQKNLRLTWYAFACAAAGAGENDAALGYLREAVGNGYRDAATLATDEDLKDLRTTLKFQQMLAALRQSTGA